MKIVVIIGILAFSFGLSLAETNQVITLDATHNTVGNNDGAAAYSLLPCKSFTIDASSFMFLKPIDSLVIGAYTNQVYSAHFVAKISSNTTRRFSIDATSLVTTNGTPIVRFEAGTRITIAFLYEQTHDPNADFVQGAFAPSEWLGYAIVK